MQPCIKRRVEPEIFSVVVAQAGYDADKAKILLNFGSPETPELVPSDLIKAAELGLVRAEEFRKNAVKFGWELWDDKNETDQDSDVRGDGGEGSVGWDNSFDSYFRAFHRCLCCWPKYKRRKDKMTKILLDVIACGSGRQSVRRGMPKDCGRCQNSC